VLGSVRHLPFLERPVPLGALALLRAVGMERVHQQPENMSWFRSRRAAKSSNVSGVCALIVKPDMPTTYAELRAFGVR
jgi:hypothetical protein